MDCRRTSNSSMLNVIGTKAIKIAIAVAFINIKYFRAEVATGHNGLSFLTISVHLYTTGR